jgi:hypothetical protein
MKSEQLAHRLHSAIRSVIARHQQSAIDGDAIRLHVRNEGFVPHPRRLQIHRSRDESDAGMVEGK